MMQEHADSITLRHANLTCLASAEGIMCVMSLTASMPFHDTNVPTIEHVINHLWLTCVQASVIPTGALGRAPTMHLYTLFRTHLETVSGYLGVLLRTPITTTLGLQRKQAAQLRTAWQCNIPGQTNGIE